MIPHKCPNCSAGLESPEIYAGRKDKCPACGQEYIVPEPPKPSVLVRALRRTVKPSTLRLAGLIVLGGAGVVAAGVIINRVVKMESLLSRLPLGLAKPRQIAHTRTSTGPAPSGPAPPSSRKVGLDTTRPPTGPAPRPATTPQSGPATQPRPVRRPATAPATAPGTMGASRPPLAPAKYARTLTLVLRGNVPLKLLLIPAGRFIMGSPDEELEREGDEPRHWVRIIRPFYLAEHELTKEQYKAVMTRDDPRKLTQPEMPIAGISWHDAVAICSKFSKVTGRKVKLPTEAQWEYACRAGTITPFSTGRKLSRAKANYDGKYIYGLGDLTLQESKPWPMELIRARSFKPNPWGLYDMHGNLAEWCRDWYGAYRFAEGGPKKQNKDPAGPANGEKRILRGGSWRTKPTKCRSAAREAADPGHKADDVGFRILVEIEPRNPTK